MYYAICDPFQTSSQNAGNEPTDNNDIFGKIETRSRIKLLGDLSDWLEETFGYELSI